MWVLIAVPAERIYAPIADLTRSRSAGRPLRRYGHLYPAQNDDLLTRLERNDQVPNRRSPGHGHE